LCYGAAPSPLRMQARGTLEYCCWYCGGVTKGAKVVGPMYVDEGCAAVDGFAESAITTCLR
jgi:hypothetical protein